MNKSDVVRARIEPELKQEVESILNELGLKTTDAINLLFRQIRLRRGIPFEICIPNEITEKAIRNAENGIGIKKYGTVDEMFNSVLSDVKVNYSEPVRKGSKKNSQIGD